MALPDYHLSILSADGVKVAQLDGTAHRGFLSLAAALRVNAAGVLQFGIAADHPVIADLEEDGQVELWRNGRLLFRTLFQDPSYTVDARDRELFLAGCVGEKDLLSRAIIAWPAGTTNRTVFTSMRAESIMQTLVCYNVTPEATVANGRLLDNPTTTISLAPDQGRGAEITTQDLAGKPLLEALQDVALAGGVDFDLIKIGPSAWQFQVFPGQRGTDRRSSVVFSRTRANMGQLAYRMARSEAKTAVVVGGQGEGALRAIAVRYGPEYSTRRHREYFHASNEGGIAALQADGDRALEERRAQPTLSFDPLQAAGTRFDVDYTLGDLVTATYRDVTAAYQVVGVSLSIAGDGKENVAAELKQQ